MKKSFFVFTVFAMLVLSLGSCKSHERCPAYGKVSSDATLVAQK